MHRSWAFVAQFDYTGRIVPGLNELMLLISKRLSYLNSERHKQKLLQHVTFPKAVTLTDSFRTIRTVPLVVILEAHQIKNVINFTLEYDDNYSNMSTMDGRDWVVANMRTAIKDVMAEFKKRNGGKSICNYNYQTKQVANISRTLPQMVLDGIDRSIEECKANRPAIVEFLKQNWKKPIKTT